MYVLVTVRTFWDSTKHLFLGKSDLGYFKFFSFGLQQWNGSKTITEKYSPFLVGLQKGKYLMVLI